MSAQIYYLIAGVIVVLTVAAHAYLFSRVLGFNHKAAQASGTVISGAWRSDGQGSSVCFPVVAFTAASGQQYQFSSNVGTTFPPQTGSTVKVQYDPTDPQRAEIGSFTGVWLTPLFFSVFGAVGVIMLIIGMLAYPSAASLESDLGLGNMLSLILLLMGGIFSLVAAGLCFATARGILGEYAIM
jgi:Protein of unknown function (DUF3592)